MFEARLGASIGHAVSLPALVFVGLLIGYVAGMFGVGGGFLLTPALIYVFGVPSPVAVGSALCQTCGTSIASFVKYRRLNRGEPRIDLVMLGGSLLGVDAGTRLLLYLDSLGTWRRPQDASIPIVQLVLGILFVLLLFRAVAFGAGRFHAPRRTTSLEAYRSAWRHDDPRPHTGRSGQPAAINAILLPWHRPALTFPCDPGFPQSTDVAATSLR